MHPLFVRVYLDVVVGVVVSHNRPLSNAIIRTVDAINIVFSHD
jgi:hypothetical protein